MGDQCAGLPDVGGSSRRLAGRHRRGTGPVRGGRPAAPGILRARRVAVRVLHPGFLVTAVELLRDPDAEKPFTAEIGAGGVVGQHLSMHGIPGHRAGGAGRRCATGQCGFLTPPPPPAAGARLNCCGRWAAAGGGWRPGSRWAWGRYSPCRRRWGAPSWGSAVALGFVLTAVPSLPTTLASGAGHHGDSRCRGAGRCGSRRAVRSGIRWPSAPPRSRRRSCGALLRPGRADGGPGGRAGRRRRARCTADRRRPLVPYLVGVLVVDRGVVGVVRLRTRSGCRTRVKRRRTRPNRANVDGASAPGMQRGSG